VSLRFKASEIEALASMLRCVRAGSIEGFPYVTRVAMAYASDGSLMLGFPRSRTSKPDYLLFM
jgi:hypothetical protein